MKQQAKPTVSLLQLLGLAQPLQDATLLPAAKVQGRSVYVVNVPAPKPPANLPDAQKKLYQDQVKNFKLHLMIDKQNYQLLQLEQSGGQMTMSVDLTSQSIGGNFAPSAFTFTPPAGAKEFVPPTPNGGVPGGLPTPGGGAPVPGGLPKK
jgi:hypothetical protein